MPDTQQTVIVLSYRGVYGVYADVAALRECPDAPFAVADLVTAGAHSGQADGFDFRVMRVRSAL